MNESALFSAVERGDAEATRAMLAAEPDLARARDETGATALHVAAFHGHRAIVDLLLAAGADVNARDDTHGATPAGWAIHPLREHGALLAIEIEDALFAIRRGDVELLTRLVARHPALVDAVDRSGTALETHAERASVPEIGQLFRAQRAMISQGRREA
jgi:ankyrin repeat protein